MEISSNLYKLAAENLLQKSEHNYDKEMKILKSKNEILEEELRYKKKNLEEENENLRMELEKNINEKGFHLIYLDKDFLIF